MEVGFHRWKSDILALQEDWFNNNLGFSVIGMPPQFWNWAIVENIVKGWGT